MFFRTKMGALAGVLNDFIAIRTSLNYPHWPHLTSKSSLFDEYGDCECFQRALKFSPQSISIGFDFDGAPWKLEIRPYVWGCLQPVIALHKKHVLIWWSIAPLLRTRRTGGSRDRENPGMPRVYTGKVSDEQTGAQQVIAAARYSGRRYGVALEGLTLYRPVLRPSWRVPEYIDTCDVPDLTGEEMGLIESAGTKRHQSFFEVSSDWTG
ncbi:hypothetical protein DFH29DRAFT_882285 [Suillus ampliporus]|nr:hypothetical protein DFH29DRAFT_882285 [Suillus ampliporus]